MINITDKTQCNGCYACANICPKNCISMQFDNEGFAYPVVDKENCIECRLCEKVCINLNIPKVPQFKAKAYACKNKNENVRVKSSSGGVFTLLCEEVIKNGGVVFGAAYDSNQIVCHSYAETMEECGKFRGSKYVQSNLGDTFKQVKKFLGENRQVIFTGTPCQIAGLDNYLAKKYKNLILIDVACHGVPSPLVYRKYLECLEEKNKSKISSVNFRDKSTGWSQYTFNVNFENGTEYKEVGYNNIYMQGFLSDIFLRPSCYECKFKKPLTSADITLCDYWGVKGIHPDFDDDKGISLLLINTNKGLEVYEKLSGNVDFIITDMDYAISCNPSIISAAKTNKRRKKFFSEINEKDIENLIRSSIKGSFVDRVKYKIKRILF